MKPDPVISVLMMHTKSVLCALNGQRILMALRTVRMSSAISVYRYYLYFSWIVSAICQKEIHNHCYCYHYYCDCLYVLLLLHGYFDGSKC